MNTENIAYQKAIDRLEAHIQGNRAIKVALYARISTDDKQQDPETQLYALRRFCQDANWEIYQEYIDRARAKDYRHRLAWQQLQKDARQRKFKVVLLFDLSRGWRDTRECLNCVEDWFERGIGIKSLKQDIIDTTTSMGKLILQIMAALAEFESAQVSERVAAGMARAKAQGKQIGRKELSIRKTDIYDALRTNQNNIAGAAKKLGCSRAYIYKKLAEGGTTSQSYEEVSDIC